MYGGELVKERNNIRNIRLQVNGRAKWEGNLFGLAGTERILAVNQADRPRVAIGLEEDVCMSAMVHGVGAWHGHPMLCVFPRE